MLIQTGGKMLKNLLGFAFCIPGLSLKAARNRARELRRIVDEGCDPVGNERDRRWITSFEKFLRHVAERVPRLSPKQIK
jgi:hypothetical protein